MIHGPYNVKKYRRLRRTGVLLCVRRKRRIKSYSRNLQGKD
jgi:hypothetical protein